MPIGYFLDKTHPPDTNELSSTLGATQPFYMRLLDFIANNYAMVGDLTYGGKNYGWNLWYRKSGKSLVTLFPQQDYFVAQVVLGRDQVEKALTIPLGENVSRVLHETPSLHDGRWLFIKVQTEKDVENVEQLLLVKKQPKRIGKG